MSSEALLPQMAIAPSNRQRLFMRYFTAILIDLVVLNLFVEYSGKVFVGAFTTSLLAPILLQVPLKLTIVCEHWVMDWFKARGGGGWMTFQVLRRLADPVRFEVRHPRGARPGVW